MNNLFQKIRLLGCNSRVILVLNSPFPLCLLQNLMEVNSQLYCVDGGANRLYNLQDAPGFDKIVPNFIIGDLDSIKDDTKNFYQQKGVQIIEESCQDTTDFEKCLRHIVQTRTDDLDILILGGITGRFDHVLAQISVQLQFQTQFPKFRFTIFGEQSILRVLLPGSYEIQIDEYFEDLNDCGIVPAGQNMASVLTEGFKWNLTFDTPISIGKFLSTSNKMVQNSVKITTKDPIHFITKLKAGFNIDK